MVPGGRNISNNNNTFMTTLTERVNHAVKDGFVDNMKVTRQGLYSCNNDKVYLPNEVKIVDFCRFEGASDPDDNEIMYLIETNDGDKGILIDAFGTYADEYINNFITKVKGMKKTERKNPPNHPSDKKNMA
jgi:hypothetical protein